jgi:hypothetical protein
VTTVNVNSDFSDLLQCLNDEDVRCLVVGGYAVMFHTEPRFTKDLDVWVDPTPENAKRVWQALVRFGAPTDKLSIDDLTTPGVFFVMGVAPTRIDILTTIDGVSFPEAWSRAAAGSYGGVPVRFLSVADLIRNKRAVGRPQDLLDVARLEDDA